MGEVHLEEGRYITPAIWPEDVHADFPESCFVVQGGQLHLDSALLGKTQSFKDMFPDPRARNFVDAVVRHHFHLLDTRQLSVPEAFETRVGAGRMNRLTTLVESAAIGARLGATFEQTTQVMLSDVNVTVDSHRLGDHLVGDFENESARDGEIIDYIDRSGLLDHLTEVGVVQPDGYLVDSPTHINTLAAPHEPRRKDRVECDRPDGNLDRTPFTLFEGLYLVDQGEIVDAVNSLIRVEVKGENGEVEERLAFNDVEAARLAYQLSVRHYAEHWGEPLHHVVEELLSLADRYRFVNDSMAFTGLKVYHPVDYLRTSEAKWYEEGTQDTFVQNVYGVARALASLVRDVMLPVQAGYEPYNGPASGLTGLKLEEGVKRTKSSISANCGKLDKTGELWVALPTHKIRQPIDSLVATPNGLKRVSEIDQSLVGFAAVRMRRASAYLAKVTLPGAVIRELNYGIRKDKHNWTNAIAHQSDRHPLKRPSMPKSFMSDRIDRARTETIARAFIPLAA